MTKEVAYSFSTPFGIFVVNAADTTSQVSGAGTGYAINGISGTFNGSSITGLIGAGGVDQTSGRNFAHDNTIFVSDNQGVLGSTDGIDNEGIAFNTADGGAYNIYTASGVFYVSSGISSSTISKATLQATDEPQMACYCPGTLILTDRGEVPVEGLAIGDTVVTASGRHCPIKWIGRRSYVGRFLATNPSVQPIRFGAGSLGDGLPRRDLRVSPAHAIFLDGVLVPAQCLVNGTTIAQQRGLDRVDYYHVELDCHDVLLAEGAPSESFMDDDSRGMFQNAHEFDLLYPDAPRADGFCAPRVEQGAQLEAIRRRLARVAGDIAQAA